MKRLFSRTLDRARGLHGEGAMRITPRLLHVASLLIAAGAYGLACGGSTTDSNSGGDAGSPKDGASDDAPVGCGGCGCNTPADSGFVDLTSDQACALLESQNFLAVDVTSTLCRTYCPNASGCQIDTSYLSAVENLNHET